MLSTSSPSERRSPIFSLAPIWIVLFILLLGGLFSVLIPPGKSPDEADHLVRAYLLSQGQILLKTQPCVGESALCHNGVTMSGGSVDTGLLEYLAQHNPYQRRKESTLDQQSDGDIQWQHKGVFSHAPGTGYYFPLVYFPQALALSIAKAIGLTIDHSYYLARSFAMISGVLVLALAFYISPPQPIVLAFLLLPMSLFQMASASIDFLCNSLAVLAIACFMRLIELRERSPYSLFWLMAISVFLVGTARAHLATLVLLLATAACVSSRKKAWFVVFFSALAILAWMAISIPGVVDFRIARQLSTGQIAAYYLAAPGQLVRVMMHTLTDTGLLKSYGASFLGLFLDYPLGQKAYDWLVALLILVFLTGMASPRLLMKDRLARASLLLTGAISILLAFLAMLLTWTPHPASVVRGVQGRYLLIPIMLMLLAMCRWQPAPAGVFGRGIRCLSFCVFVSASILISVQKLLQAYYVQPVVFSPNQVTAGQGVVEPSPVLGANGMLPIELPPQAFDPALSLVDALGFQVGSYGHALQGTALLVLTDIADKTHQVKINLNDVIDNSYVFARVPPAHYKQAELRIVDGEGGFSLWTFRAFSEKSDSAKKGSRQIICTVLIHQDRSVQQTPGCPPLT
ncbi:MAG: DUF2142 domain-containing protein [Lautropia sp.]|nr:DUF2142 domain-containing protein [Lautropia sp.]